MARQGGLGRGLASLIPQKKKHEADGNAPEVNYFGKPDENETTARITQRVVDDTDSAKFEAERDSTPKSSGALGDISLRSVIEVNANEIVANPFQPRKHFNEVKLQELAESIRMHGIIQPLAVSRKADGGYELIAGERRLEASKLAGIEKVPVIIKKVNEQEKLELALIENIQRHDLDIIEEARSYKQLQDVFSLTQEDIAKRVGKSRPSVANILRLLNLPIEIQKALQTGRITEGHARTILAISNPEKQRALFELIIKENLTVRQVEERVREVNVGSHTRKVKEADPEIKEKEEKLATVLGTKVKIKSSQKGGQVVIEYFSSEELSSLVSRLTEENQQ